MRFRPFTCSERDFTNIIFKNEDCLLVQYVDILTIEDNTSPYLFLFFSDYSKKNHTMVLLYVKVAFKNVLQQVVIFDSGIIKCISGCVAEGASCQKIYKNIGLCIGADCLRAIGCVGLSVASSIITVTTGCKVDKTFFKKMIGYKNLLDCPIIFCFFDGCYLLFDDRIRYIENLKIYEICIPKQISADKRGYLTVKVLE